MKKIILVALLIILLPLLSCWRDCKDYPPTIFSGYTLHNSALIDSEWKRDIGINEKVNYQNYSLSLDIEVARQSLNYTATGAELMAEDCIGPYEQGTTHGIDAFYIVTVNDYNDHFSSGDTINTIIRTGSIYNDVDGNVVLQKVSLEYFMQENDQTIYGRFYDFVLNEPPAAQEGQYIFKTILILDDGEVYEVASDAVTLIR